MASIYANVWEQRNFLHEERVQLPQDLFGTPIWPPFHFFGTPTWPPRRHVKTEVGGREFDSRWGTKIVRSFLVVSEFPFFQVKMFTGSVCVLLTTVVQKKINNNNKI